MLPVELRTLLSRALSPCYTSARYSTTSARPLRILGLESSADDTCAAVVTSDRHILSNVVLKQNDLLAKWGGIHPAHSQEAHQANMGPAIKKALQDAGGLKLDDLDGIAFTAGPGMYGCISVCSGAAKALSAATGLPLLGVHHMQAHALTPFLTEAEPPSFPFLTLLLSGGHTLLLLARSETSFKILATTHDESIGQSLDKASRDLQIPLALGNGSAGAAMETLAFSSTSAPHGLSSSPSNTPLPPPRFPLPFRNELKFSYAGARSALTRLLSAEPPDAMSEGRKRDVAAAFMRTAFEQVGEKVGLAIKAVEAEEAGSGDGRDRLGGLVVSGGVAANLYLRKSLRAKLDSLGYSDMRLIFPPPHLCTDNAAMIAHLGHSRLRRGRTDPLSVGIRAKWSIEDCEAHFENQTEEKKCAEDPGA